MGQGNGRLIRELRAEKKKLIMAARIEKKAMALAKEKRMLQREIRELIISIEWKRSRTWGMNPHAEAAAHYKDPAHQFERRNGYTASGCGYDKASTVLAEIFNDFLRYKLYQPHTWDDTINGGRTNHPYGVYYYDGGTGKQRDGYIWKPSYNGGVGVCCYFQIGKFIGGTFEQIASGKTFDVFKYTD